MEEFNLMYIYKNRIKERLKELARWYWSSTANSILKEKNRSKPIKPNRIEYSYIYLNLFSLKERRFDKVDKRRDALFPARDLMALGFHNTG